MTLVGQHCGIVSKATTREAGMPYGCGSCHGSTSSLAPWQCARESTEAQVLVETWEKLLAASCGLAQPWL